MGPIEAVRMESIGLAFCRRRFNRVFPSKVTKFLTVDELVNVITLGRRFGSFRIERSLVREDCGITVS